MAQEGNEMLRQALLSMPNMTEVSSKQVLSDWEKNPGKMFADNSQTNTLNTLSTFTLDRIRVQDFYNPLENEDVIQRYSQEYGNIQRLYMPDAPAVDADYQKPWVDGTSSDMFKKRQLIPTQAFAYSNISYNNRVSIKGAMFYTSTFQRYGDLETFNTAVQQSVLNDYSMWRYALYNDVIGRQTVKTDLTDAQSIKVHFADPYSPTQKEAADFAKVVLWMLSVARINGKRFNEIGFRQSVADDNVKILVRVGTKAALQMALLDAYNPQIVDGVINKLVEVPYLGVPTYYQDDAHTTKLYPQYNADGMILSLNTNENGTGTTVALNEAYVDDSASDVFAIAIDKRRISYVTAVSADGRPTDLVTDWTIYNPEGDYRNFYARVLGNPSEGAGARLFGDSSYLFVKFVNEAQA